MPTVSLGFCSRRPVFLECGDNDQREAAPLWLFGLFRLTVRPPPNKKRRGARRASLPAALQIWLIVVHEPERRPIGVEGV